MDREARCDERVLHLTCANERQAQAAAELLPLVYAELRQLAARKMARENPGQTLQANDQAHRRPDEHDDDTEGNGVGGIAAHGKPAAWSPRIWAPVSAPFRLHDTGSVHAIRRRDA